MPHPTFLQAATAIAQAWPWFWPLVGGMFGAVMGSFLECMRYRIPRGIPLRQPPSECPACHMVLGVPDLVPVFSYLALRGRCRHCGVSIGLGALLMEIACTAIGAALVFGLQHYLLGARF